MTCRCEWLARCRPRCTTTTRANHAATQTMAQPHSGESEARPADVEQAVLDLAGRSDLLLFGELHGTREVPALIAGLLRKLATLGYGGLGLEAPSDQRQALADWANGQAPLPPPFYAQPSRDGRGSIEALEMVNQAATLGLQV